MNNRTLTYVLAISLISAGALYAQSANKTASTTGSTQKTSDATSAQTITLQDPACRPVPDDALKLIDKETGTVLESDIPGLVKTLLSPSGDDTSCGGLATSSYIKRNFAPLLAKQGAVAKLTGPLLLHILVWGDPADALSGAGRQQQEVQYQNWYVFDKGHLMQKARILGGDRVTFVYVHLNVHQTYHALYDFSVAEAIPSNVADLKLLLGVLTNSTKALEPVNIWGGKELVLDYSTSDITVDAKYFQSLEDLPPSDRATRKNQTDAQKQADSGPATTNPSDPPGSSPKSALALDKTQKIHDEGPTWWDVSIGVPIRKMSQLKFQNDNLTPQSIDKRYAFGLLDLDPFAQYRFFSRSVALLAPIFIGGLPLSSQPLHEPLVAVGWGPKFVKLYVGSLISKQQTISNPPKGTCTGWCPQLAFGINVSLKDAKNALSSGSKSKTQQ